MATQMSGASRVTSASAISSNTSLYKITASQERVSNNIMSVVKITQKDVSDMKQSLAQLVNDVIDHLNNQRNETKVLCEDVAAVKHQTVESHMHLVHGLQSFTQFFSKKLDDIASATTTAVTAAAAAAAAANAANATATAAPPPFNLNEFKDMIERLLDQKIQPVRDETIQIRDNNAHVSDRLTDILTVCNNLAAAHQPAVPPVKHEAATQMEVDEPLTRDSETQTSQSLTKQQPVREERGFCMSREDSGIGDEDMGNGSSVAEPLFDDDDDEDEDDTRRRDTINSRINELSSQSTEIIGEDDDSDQIESEGHGTITLSSDHVADDHLNDTDQEDDGNESGAESEIVIDLFDLIDDHDRSYLEQRRRGQIPVSQSSSSSDDESDYTAPTPNPEHDCSNCEWF
jgi:hypothetical protein